MNGTKHTYIEPKLLVGRTSPDLTAKKNVLPEFSPCSEAISLYIEEIHNRAEAMTPLLREILNFRPSMESSQLKHQPLIRGSL